MFFKNTPGKLLRVLLAGASAKNNQKTVHNLVPPLDVDCKQVYKECKDIRT
jgi:hypothetical protein